MPKISKRELLAEERTILAEERTLAGNIRTVLAFIGLLIVVLKFILTLPWWPVIAVLIILTLAILVEDIYRLFKTKKREKELKKKTGI